MKKFMQMSTKSFRLVKNIDIELGKIEFTDDSEESMKFNFIDVKPFKHLQEIVYNYPFEILNYVKM